MPFGLAGSDLDRADVMADTAVIDDPPLQRAQQDQSVNNLSGGNARSWNAGGSRFSEYILATGDAIARQEECPCERFSVLVKMVWCRPAWTTTSRTIFHDMHTNFDLGGFKRWQASEAHLDGREEKRAFVLIAGERSEAPPLTGMLGVIVRRLTIKVHAGVDWWHRRQIVSNRVQQKTPMPPMAHGISRMRVRRQLLTTIEERDQMSS